jgi:hypothetical protein
LGRTVADGQAGAKVTVEVDGSRQSGGGRGAADMSCFLLGKKLRIAGKLVFGKPGAEAPTLEQNSLYEKRDYK